MRRPKPNWRAVKRHRNYTVDELARTLGVAKGTVRRWLSNGLPCLADQKPFLILGTDVHEFHRARGRKKQKCKSDELYCVKCRVPRQPFDLVVEYVPIRSNGGNLRGLCPSCGTLMHKRVPLSALARIKGRFEVSFPQGLSSLMDTGHSPSNEHLAKEANAHG